MAMRGVITARDVILHPALIVSSFGVRSFVRCCWAIAAGRRTTFLDCVLVDFATPKHP